MQKLESEKVVIQTLKNLRDIFDKVSLERVAQLAGNQNAQLLKLLLSGKLGPSIKVNESESSIIFSEQVETLSLVNQIEKQNLYLVELMGIAKKETKSIKLSHSYQGEKVSRDGGRMIGKKTLYEIDGDGDSEMHSYDNEERAGYLM